MGKLSKAQANLRVQELETNIESLNTSHSLEIENKDAVFAEERKTLNQNIEILQKESDSKTKQLNEKELKKLAAAYAEQEEKFAAENRKWFWFVIGSCVMLLLSIVGSALIAYGNPWYERFEYYLADFVFVTFLIFCLRQYSLTGRFRVDFANRKTLAQSYQNIISTGTDDEIKGEFLSKATAILCAPVDHSSESYTIPEKLIESIGDLVKTIRN